MSACCCRSSARTDTDRRVALRSIGPVWDGNEVWLIVAGGATFAAFPEWYASVFSGFYLAFALLLVGLILRGIGIEYRGKAETARGRRWCDGAVVVGSFLPALLLGRGVRRLRPRREDGRRAQHDRRVLRPALALRPARRGRHADPVRLPRRGVPRAADRGRRSRCRPRWSPRASAPVTGVAAVAFLVWTTQVRGGWVSWVLAAVIAVVFVAGVGARCTGRATGWRSPRRALVCLLVPSGCSRACGRTCCPPAATPALSLTVHNASSSHYTLVVMTVVALIFTPIVLAYQAWTYWVFRARVGVATVGHDSSATIERIRAQGGRGRRVMSRPLDPRLLKAAPDAAPLPRTRRCLPGGLGVCWSSPRRGCSRRSWSGCSPVTTAPTPCSPGCSCSPRPVRRAR